MRANGLSSAVTDASAASVFYCAGILCHHLPAAGNTHVSLSRRRPSAAPPISSCWQIDAVQVLLSPEEARRLITNLRGLLQQRSLAQRHRLRRPQRQACRTRRGHPCRPRSQAGRGPRTPPDPPPIATGCPRQLPTQYRLRRRPCPGPPSRRPRLAPVHTQPYTRRRAARPLSGARLFRPRTQPVFLR